MYTLCSGLGHYSPGGFHSNISLGFQCMKAIGIHWNSSSPCYPGYVPSPAIIVHFWVVLAAILQVHLNLQQRRGWNYFSSLLPLSQSTFCFSCSVPEFIPEVGICLGINLVQEITWSKIIPTWGWNTSILFGWGTYFDGIVNRTWTFPESSRELLNILVCWQTTLSKAKWDFLQPPVQ